MPIDKTQNTVYNIIEYCIKPSSSRINDRPRLDDGSLCGIFLPLFPEICPHTVIFFPEGAYNIIERKSQKKAALPRISHSRCRSLFRCSVYLTSLVIWVTPSSDL